VLCVIYRLIDFIRQWNSDIATIETIQIGASSVPFLNCFCTSLSCRNLGFAFSFFFPQRWFFC
jgi:lipoprotein signal peptidase